MRVFSPSEATHVRSQARMRGYMRAANRSCADPATSSLHDGSRPVARQLDQRSLQTLGRSAQLGSQFLGHAARIDAVADDLRANEDDQLGSLPAASVVGKGIADPI